MGMCGVGSRVGRADRCRTLPVFGAKQWEGLGSFAVGLTDCPPATRLAADESETCNDRVES